MKFNSIEAKKILDEINKVTEKSVDYTTKDGCNDYLDAVSYALINAKEKLDNIQTKSVYKLEDIEIDLIEGRAKELFEEGDELHFELLTGEPVGNVYIEKKHDIMKNDYYANLSFAFLDCLDGEFPINKENSSKGGWDKCYMNTVTLGRIFKLLPKTIQDLIVPVVKFTGNNGKLEKTINKLFLLSVKEYVGDDADDYNVLEGEGEQYSWFKKGNKIGLGKYWWTRSPYPSYNGSWNYVTYNGAISTSIVNGTYCVCP